MEVEYGWYLYKERWFVLFVAMFASFSAGILWMTYSTTVNLAVLYYQVDLDFIHFLPISVLICSVSFSLVAMYILDKKNLKTGLRLGTFLITFGYLIRIMPKFFPQIFGLRYYFSLMGHCFVGFGLPFIVFTPSKVAEYWFPESSRIFATTIVSLGYLSGLIFSDLVVEKITKQGYDLCDVTLFLGIPSLISLILTFFLKNSKPKTPPSGSAAVVCYRPFFPSIFQLIKQNVFCILMFYIGTTIGSFLSTILVIQELVKVNLNNIIFSSQFSSFYIGGGLLGAIISSLFVSKIQSCVLVMKIAVAGHCITNCFLFLILRFSDELIQTFYWRIAVLLVSGFIGFFCFTIIPFGLDLSSSCSFPNCTEATANGLLMVSGQVFGILFTLIMRTLAEPVCVCPHLYTSTNETITDNYLSIFKNRTSFDDCPKECCTFDYSFSMIIQTCIIVFSGSMFIFYFQTEFCRMNDDRRTNVNRILQIEEVEQNNDTIFS